MLLKTKVIQFIGINGFSSVIKTLLFVSPVTPFLIMFGPLLHYGVIDPAYAVVLFVQAIIYCAIAIFVLYKKAGRTFRRKKRL